MNFFSNRGDNRTLQHSWKLDSWKDTITQFYFQLVRGGFDSNHDLTVIFRRLLTQSQTDDSLSHYLFRLVVQTRDILKGKGERDLYYTLLKEMWDAGFTDEAIRIFRHTCHTDAGSWKDVKYLVYSLTQKDDYVCLVSDIHPLAQGVLQLLASQIEKDYTTYQNSNTPTISLAARWAPRREKGKFNRVTKFFVQTIHATKRYSGKSMRDVRKMLSILNHELKTPQIDMCRGTWRQLRFNSMTSYTLLKFKKSFANVTKTGEQRSSDEDRITCATQYSTWLNSNTKSMNVGTIFPYEFVRDVYNKSLSGDEIKYYNDAWKTQTETQSKMNENETIGTMIPMIDVSGSMTSDENLPMLNAIALGIRLSELNHGRFHNRALTFESNPSWALYSDSQTFVEKVAMTQRLGWGGSTDFHKALTMILKHITTNQLSPLTVQNMSLVVLSDMQMDHSSSTPYSTVYESIKQEFHQAGLKSSYQCPYDVPHIVFWNLRKTNGFPSVTHEKGVTMISGYNSSLIEVLLTKGTNVLRTTSPWDMLQDILDNTRFNYR